MENNRSWNLESFLDSLIIELDKARETLSVKAINRPLTYAVKDVNLEMQLFPSFDGRQVSFRTARPGQTGASKIAIQLGSITDDQIRKTSRDPITKDDISIETLDGIDEETKEDFRKVGIQSVKDLVRMEQKNVDLKKVNRKKIDYGNLANLLQKARRGDLPPSVKKASLSLSGGRPVIRVEGTNLSVDKTYRPVAIVNGDLAAVTTAGRNQVIVEMPENWRGATAKEVVLALDPFTVCRFDLTADETKNTLNNQSYEG